ncbi:hypothetical protein AB0A60_20530 [Streptomyces sp. NPDC046275]|uniref:hypothetical protein n=1 Tax=Streptomyces sp. NPDC046275 TaxID=3157201 RepID=UPI0033C24C86
MRKEREITVPAQRRHGPVRWPGDGAAPGTGGGGGTGAGRWGACAIGCRPGPGADRRVRLNPPKDEVRRWDAEDEVIVVARGPGPG